MSLRFFHKNDRAINTEVYRIFNDICLKSLQDIMQEAEVLRVPINAIFHSTNPIPNPSPSPRDSVSSSLATPFSYFSNQYPISRGAHPNERTIFLSFSIRCPIWKVEALDFLTRKFGNCFQAIYT
ncbi:hypothetical protein SAY87_027640 [Trapa incisa]|uniref:Uncharacterized protein n=1 Tax=Trapa incisa TaxID=236973 RepID=A0AAN7JMQ8_9MYRT|nr:hypothetical protein SAY87_027640 [Trapa incisa]